MDSAAAEIKIINGRLVIRPARYRTHEEELIDHKLTVVEVAFGETVGGFEIKRSDDVMRDA